CPMGIDIRDGQQLECITCALCIDACDDVMDKLGKERGLISYATLNDYNLNMALAGAASGQISPKLVRSPATGKLVDQVKHTNWRSVLRPRSAVYLALWAAIGVGMLVALSLRSPVGINVLHDRNPLFVVLKDGSVQNGYAVKILNMTSQPQEMILSVVGLPGATIMEPGASATSKDELRFAVQPDLVLPVRVFVRTAAEGLAAMTDFTMVVKSLDGQYSAETKVRFETPEVAP
ncbi:FixG Ig-like domain-containing protein, partial [Devosia sp.]|uniref:FixG Ig-like domain-containing protein n=1 Tax=Devosia sp. TaxID=1871048 RepID=UPI003264ABDD